MTIQMYDLCGRDPDRRFSPYCWRTRMALAHKGLEVDAIPWRFIEKDKLAFAGSTTAPVIVDGANTVADSWKIALYLDTQYSDRPALLSDAAGTGAILFLRQWTERVLHLALLRIVLLDAYNCLDEENQAYFRPSREKRFGTTLEKFVEDREGHLVKFKELLAPVRAVVEAQPYLGGERPSYADYIVFGVFQWARSVSPVKLLASDDPLYAWRGRLLGLYDGLAAKSVGYEV